MREMLHTLDRAQKAGVAVCLLISPHYFPHWALAKWPQLQRRRQRDREKDQGNKDALHYFTTLALHSNS